MVTPEIQTLAEADMIKILSILDALPVTTLNKRMDTPIKMFLLRIVSGYLKVYVACYSSIQP